MQDIAAIAAASKQMAASQVQQGAMKECPRCAESIKAAAKMCRFCQYEFSSAELSTQRSKSEPYRYRFGEGDPVKHPRHGSGFYLRRGSPGMAVVRFAHGPETLPDSELQ